MSKTVIAECVKYDCTWSGTVLVQLLLWLTVWWHRAGVGEVVCEAPNNAVGQFHGALLWSGQSYALDIGHLLLRGCSLRNTSWCFGMVVFAGRDSKLLMNDTAPQSSIKQGHLDKMIDQLVIWVRLKSLSFRRCYLCSCFLNFCCQFFVNLFSLLQKIIVVNETDDGESGQFCLVVIHSFSTCHILVHNAIAECSLCCHYCSCPFVHQSRLWTML